MCLHCCSAIGFRIRLWTGHSFKCIYFILELEDWLYISFSYLGLRCSESYFNWTYWINFTENVFGINSIKAYALAVARAELSWLCKAFRFNQLIIKTNNGLKTQWTNNWKGFNFGNHIDLFEHLTCTAVDLQVNHVQPWLQCCGSSATESRLHSIARPWSWL